MTLEYLLDTNVLSEPTKVRPNAQILKRLDVTRDVVAMPAPVWNELLFGCYRLPASRRRTELEGYVRDVVGPSIPVLPYDAAAAEWHADQRARLVARGATPKYIDGAIAAIAFTRRLVLVTKNVKDFERFEGLAVEDWSVQKT